MLTLRDLYIDRIGIRVSVVVNDGQFEHVVALGQFCNIRDRLVHSGELGVIRPAVTGRRCDVTVCSKCSITRHVRREGN